MRRIIIGGIDYQAQPEQELGGLEALTWGEPAALLHDFWGKPDEK